MEFYCTVHTLWHTNWERDKNKPNKTPKKKRNQKYKKKKHIKKSRLPYEQTNQKKEEEKEKNEWIILKSVCLLSLEPGYNKDRRYLMQYATSINANGIIE